MQFQQIARLINFYFHRIYITSKMHLIIKFHTPTVRRGKAREVIRYIEWVVGSKGNRCYLSREEWRIHLHEIT